MKKVTENSDNHKYRQNTVNVQKFHCGNSFEFSPMFFDILVFSFVLSIKTTVSKKAVSTVIELGEFPRYISTRTRSTLTMLYLASV